MSSPNKTRRSLLSLAGLSGLGLFVNKAQAADDNSLKFGGESAHKLVYQCNKADDEYLGHILFSVGEMIRKYGDGIDVVVTAFGPGVQLLGQNPTRPIAKIHQQRVSSLLMYGVNFHACGNTMKSLGWKEIDLLDGVTVVEVGAVDLMLLQEKGYSYISW
jgi:intracellular sulfur oxidation DsrE/DsrF family protein